MTQLALANWTFGCQTAGIRVIFARQAMPMVWDFRRGNAVLRIHGGTMQGTQCDMDQQGA